MDHEEDDGFTYSKKYEDDEFEYQHVILPEDMARILAVGHLMSEADWRRIGFTNLAAMARQGWEHYMIHGPEPHVILLRRPKKSGTVLSEVNKNLSSAKRKRSSLKRVSKSITSRPESAVAQNTRSKNKKKDND